METVREKKSLPRKKKKEGGRKTAEELRKREKASL